MAKSNTVATVATIAKPAARKAVAPAKVAKPFAFTGRGKDARNAALGTVAVAAYQFGKARADIVACLKDALGAKPSADEVAACRTEYVIGRVAQKLSGDASHATKSVVDLIEYARTIVLHYAEPLKDGVKANKLRAGKTGRRSVAEHKAVRASEEAWSQVKAEVVPEMSTAKTQAERNKAKASRAPAAPGSTQRGKAGKAPTAGTGITHSELVKADGPMTKDAAIAHVEAIARGLLQFINKHADVTPAAYGQSVNRFHNAIMQLRIDAAK